MIRQVVVNVPLAYREEALEVELGYGNYGVCLRYIGPSGTPKLTLMLPPHRARMVGRALIHAADASDDHAHRPKADAP